MKKQTKSNFVRMVALLPELDVEKQRRILGGTAVAITPPEDVNMIPVTTVSPCLTVESIPITTTMAPAPTLTSPVETSSMPVSTISTPLETMPTPEMVTPSVPVLSCVTVECVPTITTMAPEPTLTSPVETSSMPVSTVSTPLETTSTPEMATFPMTESTTLDLAPVFYTDSLATSTKEDLGCQVWDSIVGYAESTIDKVVHVFSGYAASLAEGIAYAYLDFKYNGWDAGNGICNIPIEEYMRVRDEYHAYHFSFEQFFWREEERLPENPSYSDMREVVDVITLPGFVYVNSGCGKVADYIITYGVNRGVRYGIDSLLDLGESPK